MVIPEWFWTVEYLLAPFLVGLIAIALSVWMYLDSRKGNARRDALLRRIAKALEKGHKND